MASSTLYNLIKSKILFSGPIPVAEYMKLALTASCTENILSSKPPLQNSGYYMKKDVFGEKGDFITSPEISQMFGEVLAAWGIDTWIQMGGPRKFNIVELGPGRGTMSRDILRVFKKFEHIVGKDVTLHLVEVSPTLATLQYATLCSNKNLEEVKTQLSDQPKQPNNGNLVNPLTVCNTPWYHQGVSDETGFDVRWYRDVKDLPNNFLLIYAHEFFDALPIHKLQKVKDGWREILVDISKEQDLTFRYVISREETPVVKLLKQRYPSILSDPREHIEVSIDSLRVLENLVNRLNAFGGIVSVIDYGHTGEKQDTFRAFKNHRLCDPLINPGNMDLTADVDFAIMKKVLNNTSKIVGPATQHDFFLTLGIGERLKSLTSKATDVKTQEAIKSGYNMIMNDMGSRFKVLTVLPKILNSCMPDFKVPGY